MKKLMIALAMMLAGCGNPKQIQPIAKADTIKITIDTPTVSQVDKLDEWLKLHEKYDSAMFEYWGKAMSARDRKSAAKYERLFHKYVDSLLALKAPL